MGRLTDLDIRKAVSNGKDYLLADGGGLSLRVRPSGKAWVYLYKQDGKSVKLGLVLLCHNRSLAFARRQHGYLGSVLSEAAAIRSHKLVVDDGTWRCVRWAATRLAMRG